MNVIANAFAFQEAYGNSMQLNKKKCDEEKRRLYMKNIVVSLISAKKQNPEDAVVLFTNTQPEEQYVKLLRENGVEIRELDFDAYNMPKQFAWALAFYKLKVLDYLAKDTDYEKILLLDTDTYTALPYTDLWNEVDYGLMLCPVNHTFSHEERDKIRMDYRKLYPGEEKNLIHYGGELICARRQELRKFMDCCEEVYRRIVASNYDVAENIGDETILAIAALHYKEAHPVLESGAYLFRYWTEKRFYLASTNWNYNGVCIWHVPSEKDRGMLLLFRYFQKHGEFPGRKKAATMLALPSEKRPLNYWTLKGRYLRWKSNRISAK